MNKARPAVDREGAYLSLLQIGVATVDITPPIGISANPWGKSKSAISRGIHKPMEATVAAISSDGDRDISLIYGLDLGWIGCHQCDVVNFRARLARELKLDIDSILVNLSQTHKGPPFCLHEPMREGGELVAGYIEKTIEDLISAGKRAIQSRQKADLTWGYGKCALGSVRDLLVTDGETTQVVVGYNPELEPDDTLVVGRVTDQSGKIILTIVNYGCHPTSVGWESDLISPDYVLAPARELRFDQVITSGSNLASWLPTKVDPNELFDRKKIYVEMPHKELLTDEQMRTAWAPITATEVFLNFRIRKQHEIRIDYVTGDGTVKHPVWIWQLGDAIVIAHGGEAYLELARDLRRRNADRMIIFLDMTNGPGYLYLPTKIAYQQNNYQSQQSIVASGGLEIMLEVLDQAVKSL
jgi:hypothetical protein